MTDAWQPKQARAKRPNQVIELHIGNESGRDLADVAFKLVTVPEVVLDEEEWEDTRWDISILLTTDEHLSELHAEYLDDDSATDVMSFNYGLEPTSFIDFGEIVISVDRAEEQAKTAGWTIGEEITFLLIHGMLHLCGWVDDDDDAREAMLSRQREIMTLLQ